LPCHQKKGYGKFIISLSYELSKIERKPGSPEKPISDLGLVSYKSYWSRVLIEMLRGKKAGDELSIDDISKHTCMTTVDIIETLKGINVLLWHNGQWYFSITHLEQMWKERIEAEQKERGDGSKIFVEACRAERLHWTPFIVDKKKI